MCVSTVDIIVQTLSKQFISDFYTFTIKTSVNEMNKSTIKHYLCKALLVSFEGRVLKTQRMVTEHHGQFFLSLYCVKSISIASRE